MGNVVDFYTKKQTDKKTLEAQQKQFEDVLKDVLKGVASADPDYFERVLETSLTPMQRVLVASLKKSKN